MPIPKPSPNETQDKFISRCIVSMNKTDTDMTPDQIKAVCFKQWKDRLPKSQPTATKEVSQESNTGLLIEGVGDYDGSGEWFAFQENAFSEATVDADKITISNVVLLGKESKNGRIYTEAAMQKALPLYEGVKVFMNHPDPASKSARSIHDLAGKINNVRFDPQGKIKGDFHGLNNQNGRLFVEIATTMPEIAGMSHNARGKFKIVNNRQVVEEIAQVHSVDLVADPATTKGFFENVNDNGRKNTMEWNDINLSSLRTSRPDLATQLIAEGEKGRDKEVSELIAERDALKVKVDEFEVVEAKRAKVEKVNKLLQESKLPKEAITDAFKEMLEKADENDVPKLIEDRKALLQNTKGGVKNNNTEYDFKESDKKQNAGKAEGKAVLTGLQ